MYVSERYCSPQGFCAYKDGDRGLGSWYLFPGALQSSTQSQGVMESALPPTLCTFPAQPRHLRPPLLTAPLSHCGPASCSEDCTWPARPPGSSLPGASDPAPRSALQENHVFWWTSCHQGMGALCLLSLNLLCSQTVPESLCSLCFHVKENCFKGLEVLKLGALVGGTGHRRWAVLCHPLSMSSAVRPADPGQQA